MARRLAVLLPGEKRYAILVGVSKITLKGEWIGGI